MPPYSCVRTLGERLAYFRRTAGFSLGELAQLTAISKSELSRLENNARSLTSAHRAMLSKAYGMARPAFDNAMAFDPTRQAIPVMPDIRPDCLFRPRREIPCYDSETFPDLPERPPTIILAMDIPLSQAGYSIHLDDPISGFMPEDGLIVADPEARTVLGDLVVNVLDRRALLLTLYRDDAGRLSGKIGSTIVTFDDRISVTRFHKVVALFPAPHLISLSSEQ